MFKPICKAIVIAAFLFLGLAAALVGLNRTPLVAAVSKEHVSPFRLEDIPFDGRAAYAYLRQICAFRATAERISGHGRSAKVCR